MSCGCCDLLDIDADRSALARRRGRWHTLASRRLLFVCWRILRRHSSCLALLVYREIITHTPTAYSCETYLNLHYYGVDLDYLPIIGYRLLQSVLYYLQMLIIYKLFTE